MIRENRNRPAEPNDALSKFETAVEAAKELASQPVPKRQSSGRTSRSANSRSKETSDAHPDLPCSGEAEALPYIPYQEEPPQVRRGLRLLAGTICSVAVMAGVAMVTLAGVNPQDVQALPSAVASHGVAAFDRVMASMALLRRRPSSDQPSAALTYDTTASAQTVSGAGANLSERDRADGGTLRIGASAVAPSGSVSRVVDRSTPSRQTTDGARRVAQVDASSDAVLWPEISADELENRQGRSSPAPLPDTIKSTPPDNPMPALGLESVQVDVPTVQPVVVPPSLEAQRETASDKLVETTRHAVPATSAHAFGASDPPEASSNAAGRTGSIVQKDQPADADRLVQDAKPAAVRPPEVSPQHPTEAGSSGLSSTVATGPVRSAEIIAAELLALERKRIIDEERQRADALARELASAREEIGALKSRAALLAVQTQLSLSRLPLGSWTDATSGTEELNPPLPSVQVPRPLTSWSLAHIGGVTSLATTDSDPVLPDRAHSVLAPTSGEPSDNTEGAALHERVPPPAPAAGGDQGVSPPPPTFSMPPETSRLLSRAERLIEQGDISAARLLLERATEAGSAAAVFRLAETYDPRVLSQWRQRGIAGDIAKAQELYARAYQHGVEQAKERISAR